MKSISLAVACLINVRAKNLKSLAQTEAKYEDPFSYEPYDYNTGFDMYDKFQPESFSNEPMQSYEPMEYETEPMSYEYESEPMYEYEPMQYEQEPMSYEPMSSEPEYEQQSYEYEPYE